MWSNEVYNLQVDLVFQVIQFDLSLLVVPVSHDHMAAIDTQSLLTVSPLAPCTPLGPSRPLSPFSPSGPGSPGTPGVPGAP